MEPVSLLLPEAPVRPFEDGVQASSVSKGQAYPGAAKTERGFLSPGNAVHASRGVNLSLRTPSAPELLRDAVQAPSDPDPATVSTTTTSDLSNIATGSACGSSDIAAHLRRTIARLRLEINVLIARSSELYPAAVPPFCAMNALLAAAASQDIESSSAENRRELTCVLAQLSRQLGPLALAHLGFAPPVPPPPAAAVCELPEFNGLQDDADDWVTTVNDIGAHEAWTEPQKWAVAVERLRDGAAAWHRYEGVRQQSWAGWSAALIAAFGRVPCGSSESNSTFTEDGAQEGYHLEAATANCSSPADSYAAWPGTNAGLTPRCDAVSLCNAITSLPMTESISRPYLSEKLPPCSPSPEHLEAPTHVVLDVAPPDDDDD